MVITSIVHAVFTMKSRLKKLEEENKEIHRTIIPALLQMNSRLNELEERLHQIGVFERPIAHFAHQCT